MFINEREKMLDEIGKIYGDKINPADIVLMGTFIDANQKPIGAVRDDDGAIRLIYIDEGNTLLLIRYDSKESRDLLKDGLKDVECYIRSQGYKLQLAYESSDTPKKECGEFAFSFCR